MKAFYFTDERVKALRFHAAELVDTPFAAHAMEPHMGIDCVHVNAWCYLKTGFLKSFEPPAYALDEGQHGKESKLIKWLQGHGKFIHADTPAAGDTICFNGGKLEYHVGLMLDAETFIHVLAMPKGRVIISTLSNPLYRRSLRGIFRPLED